MKPNSHLVWKVKYVPGVLSARGYNDGKVAVQTKAQTAGEPAAVQLTPDRSSLSADSRDLSVVRVAITDARGEIVPTATNLVHFDLSGPGKIIGVGNGDPSCHESDVYLSEPAVRSGTMNEWWMRTLREAKEYREVAEKFNDTRWALLDISSESGVLKAGELGVYRAHLFVTREDLALPTIPLRFGALKDTARVYVNGKLAGELDGAVRPLSIDLKTFLRSGVNTVAVLVKSTGNCGGLCRGATVELTGEPVVAAWKRSVFNGLAQVIVQSDDKAGAIKLTANADGLASAVTTMNAGVDRPATH
jgi:beta-galactosidase